MEKKSSWEKLKYKLSDLLFLDFLLFIVLATIAVFKGDINFSLVFFGIATVLINLYKIKEELKQTLS